MDIQILVYLTVLMAVIARLFASAGWKITPAVDENGKFQLNVIFIIITGFMAAIPVVQSLNLLGDPIYILITAFTAVYGTPAFLDKVGTVVTPTPTPVEPEPQPEQEDAAEPVAVDEEEEV